MSIPSESIGSPAAWSGPRRAGRDVASLASDLLPPLDFLCLLLAAWFSVVVSTHWLAQPHPSAAHGNALRHVALFVAVLAPFILYDRRFGSLASCDDRWALTRSFAIRVALLSGLLLALSRFTQAVESLPPHMLPIWFCTGLLLTSLLRIATARYVRRLQRQGMLTEAVAVVGAGPVADRLLRTLRQTRPEGFELLGIFDDRCRPTPPGSAAPMGKLAQLLELGRQRRIDWILLTLPPTAEQRTRSLVQQLQILSVPIGLCPQHVGIGVDWRMTHCVSDDLPVSLLADRPIKRWDAVIKRAEDLVGGVLITLLLLPVLAGVALAVRLSSPGPVIFRQRRHALDNREFEIFKFRTMSWAPAAVAADLQQTTRLDARITRVGRFLRATSLDELPQLLNVLKGEMSLVGPRPHAVNMRTEARLGSEITNLYTHRHRVKPGMTGWSQVNGARGATHTMAQLQRRVELDLHYIENWSVALDLKILALTVREVLKRTNAY